jgi:hypothetical protein
MGAAGVTSLAPFYLMAPSANERLTKQTTKWAPRWERNITFFRTPAERSINRIKPPVEKAVQRLEQRLPLEKVAKRVDRGIKKNLDRLGVKHT